MAVFVFRASQVVPWPLEQVFEFFSHAENLQQLTPPWLNFRIESVEPNPIRLGTLIRYSLRWRIFPIRWMTQIVVWNPPHVFVDLQLHGPYRLWRHQHTFTPAEEGTRIADEVQYELPLGLLGSIAHRLKVRSDIEGIFAFRQQAISRIFQC